MFCKSQLVNILSLSLCIYCADAAFRVRDFAQGTPPRPTPEQLKWHQGEIKALIHFNIETFVTDGDPACTQDNWSTSQKPSTFNPVQLDTDNWVESFKELGVTGAVLTAKHGCGHLLWPSKVKLPDGSPYGYRVGTPQSAIQADVLKQFSDSTKRAGISHGFYYSLTNNFYLNVLRHEVQNTTVLEGQVKVSQQEFEDIAFGHLQELWSHYGDLGEIWFDGGYGTDMKNKITKLLNDKQPNSVAFGGLGVSRSPVCWVGTESGDAPDPTWSTGPDFDDKQSGDPDSPVWCPKEVDTTLQESDHWFWLPDTPIRTLAELISVYHTSVGHNGVLEIDYAIDRTGRVAPDHAARYKEFGQWIRTCYGSAAAQAAETPAGQTFTINLKPTDTVDRVVIQEDQTFGQLIRQYQVLHTPEGNANPTVVALGTSVGNKKIDLFKGSVAGGTLELVIKESTSPITKLRHFGAYAPCPSS